MQKESTTKVRGGNLPFSERCESGERERERHKGKTDDSVPDFLPLPFFQPAGVLFRLIFPFTLAFLDVADCVSVADFRRSPNWESGDVRNFNFAVFSFHARFPHGNLASHSGNTGRNSTVANSRHNSWTTIVLLL